MDFSLGKPTSLRKRKDKQPLSLPRLYLPEDYKEALLEDKLQCVIRNFIIQNAHDQGLLVSKKLLIALPCMITSLSENPKHMFHYHCLECPALTEEEIKECDCERGQNEIQ